MSSKLQYWMNSQTDLRDILEQLYIRYNRRELIPPDPLQFVYQYSNPADMEIAALFAALMAYGRVSQIEKSLRKLFALFGPSPSAFVLNFSKTDRDSISAFKHRFTDGRTIADLCQILSLLLNKYGNIEQIFLQNYRQSDQNILPALVGFRKLILNHYEKQFNRLSPRSLRYLIADPQGQSACKRLNLFLRWMIRNDHVDPGLWKTVTPDKLIVPLDVHMTRLCRFLNLYNKEQASMRAALKVTKSFAEIVPADPVKYDFALSRIGIVENCNGKKNDRCQLCELLAYCNKRKDFQ